MIATDQSQSQRLLACGVPADTADMSWNKLKAANREGFLWMLMCENFLKPDNAERCVPAWTLSRLLELLPTSIMSALGNEYMLELSKLRMHDAWEVQWNNGHTRFATYDKQSNPKKFCKLWAKSPIEACVKAIEWLHANGYKLNDIKEK